MEKLNKILKKYKIEIICLGCDAKWKIRKQKSLAKAVEKVGFTPVQGTTQGDDFDFRDIFTFRKQVSGEQWRFKFDDDFQGKEFHGKSYTTPVKSVVFEFDKETNQIGETYIKNQQATRWSMTDYPIEKSTPVQIKALFSELQHDMSPFQDQNRSEILEFSGQKQSPHFGQSWIFSFQKLEDLHPEIHSPHFLRKRIEFSHYK